MSNKEISSEEHGEILGQISDQAIASMMEENRVFSVPAEFAENAAIKSLEEYLELSQTHDVMEHLFIIETAEMSGLGYPSLEGGEERGSSIGVALPSNSPSMDGIECVEVSPVRYDVGGIQRKYTIFTLPQEVSSNHWEYDGKPAIENLGFMPTFSSTPDGGEVVYTRFYHIFLPSYIIPLMTLAFMACYYFWVRVSCGSTVEKAVAKERE